MDAFLEWVNKWSFFLALIPLPALVAWLIKRNQEYKAIIDDFKLKLPRPVKRAKIVTEAEKKAHPFLNDPLLQRITVMNTAPHEITMDANELDIFFNKLDKFNYTGVIFHKRYKQITANLKRFEKAKTQNKNFDIVIVQELLDRVKVGFWEIVWENLEMLDSRIQRKFRSRKFTREVKRAKRKNKTH